MVSNKKLRVGVLGLGRMGKRHAVNFHDYTPRCTVVAVTDPVAAEREWATQNLEGVQVHDSVDELLARDDLDAIVVASATSVHAELTLKAMDKGLHVLCEKPLATTIDQAKEVLAAYERNRNGRFPKQKLMCAFSRRFDASYRDAHGMVASGQHGSPVVFRSQTADLLDTTGAFVKYAATSGGIFVDCSIHDIDLMLWFMGEDRALKSVQAVGVTAVHGALNAMNDKDNALATVEFEGDRIAALFCSRMMAAGQEDTTEIICEGGAVRVNMEGRKNHVQVHSRSGITRLLPQHYYERFQDAFRLEANEFTACCLDDTPAPIALQASVRAMEIAHALQRSLVTRQKIYFGSDGAETSRAKL